MAMHPRVISKRRETITALPLYHSGHLQKKHQKEKDFKRFFAELRGGTLFLYKDDTQDTYLEKLELEQMKSMELDSPYKNKMPTIFNLNLHTDKVQLKMDNADTAEVWRGYILTVVKKEIPSKLQLLPGQMVLLHEILEEEKKRNPPLVRPALPPRPAFLQTMSSVETSTAPGKDKQDPSCSKFPACFFDVTRQEAERMLDANPEYGGIILRPSTLPNNYALTIRQATASGAKKKNFRVCSTSSGFVIELDTAVKVPTLNDVVTYFLKASDYRLQPYKASQPYDTCLDAMPPPCTSITSTTAKTVPQAEVAPMKRSTTMETPEPPPAKPDESDYIEPNDWEPDPRSGQFNSELRRVLNNRRAMIYGDSQHPDENTYEEPPREKSFIVTAHWAM